MGIFNKFNRVYELFSEGGVSRVLEQTVAYVRYHTKEKWRFVYFELDLTANPYSLPETGSSMAVRRAQSADISKIKNDLYPYMEDKQEFDKRYIDQIGEGNYNCFIAEIDNKVVHYFMVFNSATDSPLMQTPFDKHKVKEKDAYLGNAYTIPDERGMWIVPHVLLRIIHYLQKETTATRALLLVHENTPGAEGFFSRLGFNVIDDAYPKSLFSLFLAGK